MKLRIFFIPLFLFLSNFITGFELHEKLKLYIFYTPSHEEMVRDWFLPSVQKYDDYDIIIERYDQECSTATFMQEGWNKTMHHKVDLIIRAIQENWNKVFVHADIDIQFFGPTQRIIKELMQGKDMLIQKDNPWGGLCAGFFACRGNQKTLILWQEIKRRLSYSSGKNDQDLLMDFVLRRNPYNIQWGYLPTHQFWGAGTFKGTVWKPGIELNIPAEILMHHANYTVGTENKIAQLCYVKEVITERRKETN